MRTRSLFARRGSVSRRGKRKGSKREGYWAAVCRGLPAHPLVEFGPRGVGFMEVFVDNLRENQSAVSPRPARSC